jgi:hypothetical protein
LHTSGFEPRTSFEVTGSQTWAISLNQTHPWLNFQGLRSLVYHKVNGGRPYFENLPGIVIPKWKILKIFGGFGR